MSNIEFLGFNQVNPNDLLVVLNAVETRKHLIDHPLFDPISVHEWMAGKDEIDSQPGCRIRAIYIDGVIAGWCGVQPDDEGVELAIVVAREFWGAGIPIFKTMMRWAKELGHKEILFHLLDSRPEYKALHKIATKVIKTELLGRCFTTYYLAVDR